MIVFGSTGSIGTQALSLAKAHKIKISALACGKNLKLFQRQIDEFKPEFVCVQDEKDKSLINFKKNHIFSTQTGLEKILTLSEDKLVLNAIVGFAGLRTSLKCKELKKELALANKESLVVAGKFLKGAKITPIDSEHAALKWLLKPGVKRLIITASGGAFFKTPLKELKNMRAKDALKHPNWSMGAKITIDSATMANKLFEIIEAFHLFNIKEIDAIIEPQSLVHALCEFKDGGTSAYLSRPDMKLAIAQAIFTKNNQKIINSLDFKALSKIKFHSINFKKYPIFSFKNALLKNVDLGLIINAANEVLVHQFLKNECAFLDIAKGVLRAVDHFNGLKISSEQELFEFDFKVRDWIKSKGMR